MKEIKKIENLVIGGNLAALEFAFREGFPIFYEKLEVPFHLEQTKEGLNKKDVIQNYAFLLSLAGLNLYNSLNYENRIENNKLVITGKNPWIKEIHFDKIHDYKNYYESETLYKVVDFIDVRSCGPHTVRELKTEDDFVREIYFYPSKRMNASKGFSLSTHNYETVQKDVMVVSYIKGKNIEDEDYSPIYSRLRLKEIMKEVGINGKRSGTRKGKIIYKSIKLEFSKREINELEQHDRNYYYSKSKNSYLNKLFNYFYGKSS